MRARFWSAVILLFCLPTDPAVAASKVGSDLLEQCQVDANLAVIACHIYVHAVSDVLEKNAVNGDRACIPANTDIDEQVTIFINWVGRHPEDRTIPASDALAHAFSHSYPCRSQ